MGRGAEERLPPLHSRRLHAYLCVCPGGRGGGVDGGYAALPSAQVERALEAGARAAAAVFEKYGFEAYAGSRLD